jgi:CubicO group peptidase (beta-lactamase class C family)
MTTIDELYSAIAAEVETGAIPACQVAIGHGNAVVAQRSFGTAGDDTRFCVFSATKPIVASMVWLLIGAGEVDPADRIGTLIPELAPTSLADVSLEQVMLHTSGFPSAPMLDVEGADTERRRARFTTWHTEWEPGTRFEYHPQSAHWVLADIIERITGAHFHDAIEARVCAPLDLPRVLGLPTDQQERICELVPMSPTATSDPSLRYNEPEIRAAGNPGGGAIMTAADLARFYQALLHDPTGLWDSSVLHDARTRVRNSFADPLMGVSANRSLGLVLAGDDGMHELRYAIFGRGCSPGSFGHAGMHAQVAWADPESGISFVFLTNAVDDDPMRSGVRSNRFATIAAALEDWPR